MNMRIFDERLLLLLCAVGLGAPLAACGGDDGAEDMIAATALSASDESAIRAYKASDEYRGLVDWLRAHVDGLLARDVRSDSIAAKLRLLDSRDFCGLSNVFAPSVIPGERTNVGHGVQRTIIFIAARNEPATVDVIVEKLRESRPVIEALQQGAEPRATGDAIAIVDSIRSAVRTARGNESAESGPNATGAFGRTGLGLNPAGGSGTRGSGGGTRGGGGGTTGSLLRARQVEADGVLAPMFRASEAVGPSRGMRRDWDAIRSRYQSVGAKARSISEVQRVLQRARRVGSETLAAERSAGHARTGFDHASALLNAFVDVGVAPSPGGMDLLHASLSDLQPGVRRTLGQEVQRGVASDRMYLPGRSVEPAVAELFRTVDAERTDRVAPELAALVDQRLISIHPYLDGNGRTTRLMADWILLSGGYPPVIAAATDASSALFWQGAAPATEPLVRVTDGMERAVALLESIV